MEKFDSDHAKTVIFDSEKIEKSLIVKRIKQDQNGCFCSTADPFLDPFYDFWCSREKEKTPEGASDLLKEWRD